jgi:hypothetical protein
LKNRGIAEGFILSLFGLLLVASCSKQTTTIVPYGYDNILVSISGTTSLPIHVHGPPVEIISFSSILGKDNLPPPSPIVELILMNNLDESLVSLVGTVQFTDHPSEFVFNVSAGNPLTSGASSSVSQGVGPTGGAIGDSILITIKGTLQSGATFSFTQPRQIIIQPTSPIVFTP